MTVRCEYVSANDLPNRFKGTENYRISKTRGRLTLDDIEEALKRTGGDDGFYMIVLNIRQDSYTGWEMGEEKGDSVIVQYIYEGEPCPLCAEITPPMYYCPHCGKKLIWEEEE